MDNLEVIEKKRIKPKYIENSNHICEFGCGKIAKYQFKNGKCCCEKSVNSCPEMKKKNGRGNKDKKRKPLSEEQKNKIRKTLKGRNIPISEETRKKMSESQKGKKRGPHSEKTKSKFREINSFHIKDYKEKHSLFYQIEELRESPNGEIQGRCKNHNCKNSKEMNGWFTPTKTQIGERIRQLESENGNGGSYFYCSDHCKNTCDLYGKSVIQIMKQDLINAGEIEEENLNIPGYEIWKQNIFNRVIKEYGQIQCEYCGNIIVNELSIHHENPIKTNPEQSLDPINGWVLCGFGKGNNCHYLLGHKSGTKCSIGYLGKLICERKFQRLTI